MKLAAFSLALILPTAALAAEPADLVASFLVGATDGATISIEYINVDLARSGPGAFGGPSSDGAFTLTVSEVEPCVFDMTFAFDGAARPVIRFDANQLSGIDYVPGVTLELPVPLTDYVMTFSGGPRLFVAPESIGVDGLPQENPSQEIYIMTSVPLDEMQAALAAFRTGHCPGIPG
jgi:hypothetical protein